MSSRKKRNGPQPSDGAAPRRSRAWWITACALALTIPVAAIEALQTAVQLDPRLARAWYNLGLALNSVEQSQEGLVALNHAESLSPDNPRIPYARATILARLGRFDEARQAAERALQIRPDYAPAVELLHSLRN